MRNRELSIQAEKDHYMNLKYKAGSREGKKNRTYFTKEEFLESNTLTGSNYNASEKKKMMEKMSNYAKYVKEMYQPKVSEKKHLELEQIKEQLQMRNVRKSVESQNNTSRMPRPV